MFKRLIVVFCLMAGGLSYAQNFIGTGNLADGYKIMRGDTKGTPFLTEEWYVGYGIYESGETTRPQQLNYDIHGNNLVYQVGSNGTINKLLDENFQGFILKADDIDYLFTKIEGSKFDREKDESKYYQIVQAPSKKVIIEFEKELEDPNASGWNSSMDNTNTAEYKMDTNYYFLNKSGKYEKVRLKKSAILRSMKDQKDKLNSYISNKNLDLSEPANLLKLVEYYHTL